MAISSCGNFCAVGLSSGHVDTYNMQSGLHRGSLGKEKGIFCCFLGPVNIPFFKVFSIT